MFFDVGVASAVLTGEQIRGNLSALITVDAGIINVIFAGAVFFVSVLVFCHNEVADEYGTIENFFHYFFSFFCGFPFGQ